MSAALRGQHLSTSETKREVMFLALFLKLSDLHQADILRFMQAYACTSEGSGAEKPF
jgi:hypothetical protein